MQRRSFDSAIERSPGRFGPGWANGRADHGVQNTAGDGLEKLENKPVAGELLVAQDCAQMTSQSSRVRQDRQESRKVWKWNLEGNLASASMGDLDSISAR
jgi:hypothetical protein